MDAVEEIADVELQVPSAALAAGHLASKGVQAIDRRMSAFAPAIRIAVINEPRVEDCLELRDEPMVHDAIREIRRMDLAWLGALGDEARRWSWRPSSCIEALFERNQLIDPF